ncbi:phosphotransferase [Arthrobacter alpinus]|nr:phosphotransferase [Arthrobacter alpinus]
MIELAALGTGFLAGESLVHGDLRADNILLTEHGVVLLDWPWAARGAAWVEGLSVLLNVKTLDPNASVEHFLADHRVFAETNPRQSLPSWQDGPAISLTCPDARHRRVSPRSGSFSVGRRTS